MNTFMDFRICADNTICVHERRPVAEGETEDSKQDIWKILIPGQDVSNQPAVVQQAAEKLWTPEVISAFKTTHGLT